MLTARLIPSLLLRAGGLVKGRGFAQHRPAGALTTTIKAHDAQSADEISIVDIDASVEGRGPDLDAIARAAEHCSTPLTVGGGIADVAGATACMRAGADKVCLNSTALRDPGLIDAIARVYGAQAVVVAMDVSRVAGEPTLWDYRTRAPVGRPFRAWLREAVDRGAGEIRLTAVEREGGRAGFDLDLLRSARDLVKVPIVIEGGAGTLEHLDAALRAGADGLALGTMLTFSDNNLLKLKRFLAQRGHSVRLG